MFEPDGQSTFTRFCKAFLSAAGYLGSFVIDPEKSTKITTSAELTLFDSSANARFGCNPTIINSADKNVFINFNFICFY